MLKAFEKCTVYLYPLSLVPNSNEVICELLNCGCSLAWLYVFRVVSNEKSLLCFDYDNSFPAL